MPRGGSEDCGLAPCDADEGHRGMCLAESWSLPFPGRSAPGGLQRLSPGMVFTNSSWAGLLGCLAGICPPCTELQGTKRESRAHQVRDIWGHRARSMSVPGTWGSRTLLL